MIRTYKQQIIIARCLIAMPGIALLVTSAALLGISVFGMPRFTLGLMLHLAGQALCLTTLCLPRWMGERRADQIARRVAAQQPAPQVAGGVRPAHFRVSVQGLRIALALAVGGFFLYGLTSGIIQTRNLLRLKREGVVTTATVTGTSYREGKAQMTVSYSFTTPYSLPVASNFRAPRALIGQYQTGSQIPVTYLPSNPDVHLWQRVDAPVVRQRILGGIVVSLLALFYVAIPALTLELRLRRQLRLARVGALVTGVIEACKPHAWRGRRRGYSLTYAFTLPNGAVWRGQAYLRHVAGEPTLPGFPITILYDVALPSANRPLAAFHAVQMATLRKTYLVS